MSKLTKILSLGLLMFSTLIALSNNTPVKENGPVNGNEKTIRDFLKFPQVLMPANAGVKSSSQKVEVLFTTEKNGIVNFVLVKTDNNILKSEIEKQFMGLHFNNLKSGVVHSVVLSFKTI